MVCISRAQGCGVGLALAFKMCAFSSRQSKQVQGGLERKRVFSGSDEGLKTPESYKISEEHC